MKYFILFTIFIFFGICIEIDVSAFEKGNLDVGYYWRGYYGDIPRDAFPVTSTESDNPTYYIGQTVHKIGGCDSEILVTGQIFESEKKMIFEWGYRQQIARNEIQILCTNHPERLKWIETNYTEIFNLTDKHLLCGGREKNYTMYIGKVERDGDIAIGKVVVTDLPHMEGMYTIMNGTYLHIKDSFSVLAYNSDFKQLSKLTSSLSRIRSGCNCIASHIYLLLFSNLAICIYFFKW